MCFPVACILQCSSTLLFRKDKCYVTYWILHDSSHIPEIISEIIADFFIARKNGILL